MELFFLPCEFMGTWASQIEFFAFYRQVKALGGFRTIALLAMPYRIRAKARMQIVREWAMTIPRAYFAAGAGKSTGRNRKIANDSGSTRR